ncbi:hypothetical protein TRVL_08683 [Trypanosoma vivax]|nr:hypothetical protein TRVL_08683 [Trypanosoma vivax]
MWEKSTDEQCAARPSGSDGSPCAYQIWPPVETCSPVVSLPSSLAATSAGRLTCAHFIFSFEPPFAGTSATATPRLGSFMRAFGRRWPRHLFSEISFNRLHALPLSAPFAGTCRG